MQKDAMLIQLGYLPNESLLRHLAEIEKIQVDMKKYKNL
jgi:hypothetical protein